MPIAGSDIGCRGGVPGCLVLNIGTETMGEGKKEPHTKGIDWPTRETSGRAQGRKEGGRTIGAPGQRKGP
jgi:hypothetical protein